MLYILLLFRIIVARLSLEGAPIPPFSFWTPVAINCEKIKKYFCIKRHRSWSQLIATWKDRVWSLTRKINSFRDSWITFSYNKNHTLLLPHFEVSGLIKSESKVWVVFRGILQCFLPWKLVCLKSWYVTHSAPIKEGVQVKQGSGSRI